MTTLNNSKRGQSLVEVIISVGLFALAISGAFLLLNNQLSNLQIIRNTLTASVKAEEGLEAARLIRDRNWDELTAGTHGLSLSANTWQFQGSSDIGNGFTRTITVSDLSSNERTVSSSISWQAFPSVQNITLTTIFSNWRNLLTQLLSGNWGNPQTLGTIDLGAGNVSTSLAVRNSLVYLTANASDSKKHDFYIVDATDGNNPALRGSINTGPGLNSVAIFGDYAYVANDNDDAQLQIINISNPNSPSLVSSLKLTDGQGEEGIAVAAEGNYVYVGTKRSDGREFFVVNVSNPLSPTVTGSLEIDADVSDIFVYNDRIFLATAKDTQEFIVINATSPTNPIQTAAIDLLGSSEDGRAVYVNSQDNRAFIVRSVGGNHSTHPEVAVIDVTNPDAPTTLGSLNFTADVNGVFAADNLLFLATSVSNEEFQIFEDTDPANMTYYSGLNFPQMATDLAFENNIIYVSVRSNDALRIITSQ